MNFPRLGVQNPQFTNAYEMERNAQANRPFSQLLNTGAKVIPAYIDQQKKEAEAQQLKGATNERNAFISNYGQGFVGGLTSPQSFMPKMTELDPTAANQLMDARKANAPKAVVASTAPVYNAQQKQLIDSLGGVDRELDRMSRMYNTASAQKNSALMVEYKSKMDELNGRRSALTNQLATSGVSAYDSQKPMEQPMDAGAPIETVAPVAMAESIDLDTDNVKRRDFVKKEYSDVSSFADLPSADDIIADAELQGYRISGKKADEIQATLAKRVENKRRDADYGRGISKELREESQKDEAAWQSGGAIDKRAASQKIEDLQANPNDNTLLADAILWYMRKQSGAMIGPTEILQYMQGKLPEDRYKELVDELSPTGLRAIAGYVAGSAFSDPMVTKITAKYTPFIKRDRLIKDLNVYAQKDLRKKTAEAPEEESKLERIRRLRAKKGDKV